MVCAELSFALLSDLLRTVDFLLTSAIESILLNDFSPPAQPSNRHASGAVVDFFLCLILAGVIIRLAPPLLEKVCDFVDGIDMQTLSRFCIWRTLRAAIQS